MKPGLRDTLKEDPVSKHQVATISMTTSSELDGESIVQSQRGGNVPAPAKVEVVVRVGNEEVRIVVHIQDDGQIVAPSWTRTEAK